MYGIDSNGSAWKVDTSPLSPEPQMMAISGRGKPFGRCDEMNDAASCALRYVSDDIFLVLLGLIGLADEGNR